MLLERNDESENGRWTCACVDFDDFDREKGQMTELSLGLFCCERTLTAPNPCIIQSRDGGFRLDCMIFSNVLFMIFISFVLLLERFLCGKMTPN